MRKRKSIGRIVHFFFPFSFNLASLNAIHSFQIYSLLFVSIILQYCWIKLGEKWEYDWQNRISLKYPSLKWDRDPDEKAYIAVLIGSLVGIFLFFLL